MNRIYARGKSLVRAELRRVQNTDHAYGLVGGWYVENGEISRNGMRIAAPDKDTAVVEITIDGVKIGSFGIVDGNDTNRWQTMRIEPNVGTDEGSAYPFAGFQTFVGPPDYLQLEVRNSGPNVSVYFFTHDGTFEISAFDGELAELKLSSSAGATIASFFAQGAAIEVNHNFSANGDSTKTLGTNLKYWSELYSDDIFTRLPTSDPSVTGQLWNDSGTVKVSA